MTGDTIECFNCGRQNPGWAQICRSCGVRLDPDQRPGGIVPTDQRSLISMGAALGTIVLGILVALFISGLDPVGPAAVGESPTPAVEPQPDASSSLAPEPEPVPSASTVPEPVASTPSAGLPGTIAFGTGLDEEQQVTGATEVFAGSDTFAHTLTMTEPFGVTAVGEQVVKISEDGTEQEVIAASGNQLSVEPDATVRGAVCCPASALISELGTGQFVLRAYIGETPIAEGRFELSDG